MSKDKLDAAANGDLSRRSLLAGSTALIAAAAAMGTSSPSVAQTQPSSGGTGNSPNILVIFGDDIGISQVSAYTMGMMGYRTPNIDRIAAEGAIFTDSYGQQSCTAGRASFILGEEPFRTGLLTIGMPGDDHGITEWMPTIADALKQHSVSVSKSNGDLSRRPFGFCWIRNSAMRGHGLARPHRTGFARRAVADGKDEVERRCPRLSELVPGLRTKPRRVIAELLQ